MKLTTESTENTERATPETDAIFGGMAATDAGYWKAVDLARKLERERDEAQATLTDIHRWIERNHPDGFIDSMTFHQNLERVGDRWYDRLLDIVERERDEAREQNAKLRNIAKRAIEAIPHTEGYGEFSYAAAILRAELKQLKEEK